MGKEEISLADFQESFSKLTKATNADAGTQLRKLTLESCNNNYRELYCKIESILAKSDSTDPAKKLTADQLKHQASRAFKEKANKSNKLGTLFQVSELEGLELADLAQTISDSLSRSTEHNTLMNRTPNEGRWNSNNRWRKPDGQAQTRPTRGTPNGRSNGNSKKPPAKANKADLICKHCDKKGHTRPECWFNERSPAYRPYLERNVTASRKGQTPKKKR